MTDKVDTKLSAARTHLILDYPFLGALALRLGMQTASWCRTLASDARKIYYNRDYVATLSLAELQFMLAHEALHCALLHFNRRGCRDRRRWNAACDFVVNGLLIKEGLTAPEGAIYNSDFDDMTAEEIYHYLDDLPEDIKPLDTHSWDTSETDADDVPPPLSPDERETLANAWRQRLAGSAQQARQAGKLSDHFKRLIDKFLQPAVAWRDLLARYVNQISREDYSYAKINHRRDADFIFPSLRSRHIDLAAAIDVSGSISRKEMSEFACEINAIKSLVRARVTVLVCDRTISPGFPVVCEAWETLKLPASVQGGGGTDFRPVFDWLKRRDVLPDALVYLTDACGKFPAAEPPLPVIWLVKGKAPVPWGQRVQFN